MTHLLSSLALFWICLAGGSGHATESPVVPNPDFRDGSSDPDEWQLSGAGRWVDREILEVHGTGEDSSAWWSDQVPMQPGELYHFQVRTRRRGGSGTAITGPAFANRDQQGITDSWQWLGHVFRVPDSANDHRLRIGQWHATGSLQFDAVRLMRTIPVHRALGDMVLGEGEVIRGDQYRFAGGYGHVGSNYHRVLDYSTATFNSNRWTFNSGNKVAYRFALPDLHFTAATVEFDVNYHTQGGCRLEISRDGQHWQELTVQRELGTAGGEIPAGWMPTKQVFVRLISADGPANFQVDRLDFRGKLSRLVPDASGETVFADIERTDESLVIDSLVLQKAATGEKVLRARLTNQSDKETDYAITLAIVGSGKHPASTRKTIEPSQSRELRLPLPETPPGEHTLRWTIHDTRELVWQARIVLRVPDFYRSDYGYRLGKADDRAVVWWCDATRKVPRQRAVPVAEDTAVRMEAARHDYEAAQIVVRPSQDLHGLTAEASDLIGPEGSRIPKQGVQILQVFYHFVDHPTDSTGVRDWWPDALPPLERPLDIAAGDNQPLWLLVHVPEDALPGDYLGHVRLTAEGFSTEIPIELHVWNFKLPKQNHLDTAFGLSVQNIWRYHGLKTEEDKRRVLDLYFRSFSEHRISPYDPAPLDPIRVNFLSDARPPRAEVDFTAFDRALEKAITRYHFTGFRLGIQGMGGGTYHARRAPAIGEYGMETDQYGTMFSSYVGQLEGHFRQRGWLGMPYVYWFDEPAPRDYEFVAAGMQRLKQDAPGLRRMLTEEPGDSRLAGLVDIWCPVSHNYDHEEAEERRAVGERVWWYVCTGPKAPYCTLFIDHPATELRVWHWQAWQRDIVGTLVWQSNYWTSSAAFPDQAQDPYKDPMGYVSGYSTPPGMKRHWGNGDGRFLYPPLIAATPDTSGRQPVIAPPVSSIRWEMLREGVEDYEYLHMLRDLLQRHQDDLSEEQASRFEQLLIVPSEITAEMMDFTTDSAPIYECRRAIAEAIEALRRQVK